jgi:hypothetical protein
MNKNEFEDMILTPNDRKCYAIGVKGEKGNISNSTNISTIPQTRAATTVSINVTLRI